MEKVYIIFYENGSHYDFSDEIIAIYSSFKKAQNEAEKMKKNEKPCNFYVEEFEIN